MVSRFFVIVSLCVVTGFLAGYAMSGCDSVRNATGFNNGGSGGLTTF